LGRSRGVDELVTGRTWLTAGTILAVVSSFSIILSEKLCEKEVDEGRRASVLSLAPEVDLLESESDALGDADGLDETLLEDGLHLLPRVVDRPLGVLRASNASSVNKGSRIVQQKSETHLVAAAVSELREHRVVAVRVERHRPVDEVCGRRNKEVSFREGERADELQETTHKGQGSRRQSC